MTQNRLFNSPYGSWPNEKDAPNIFVFMGWMAAYVSSQWGGPNTRWLPLCGDMVKLVFGRAIGVTEKLSADYGWTPVDAIELAKEAMRDG